MPAAPEPRADLGFDLIELTERLIALPCHSMPAMCWNSMVPLTPSMVASLKPRPEKKERERLRQSPYLRAARHTTPNYRNQAIQQLRRSFWHQISSLRLSRLQRAGAAPSRTLHSALVALIGEMPAQFLLNLKISSRIMCLRVFERVGGRAQKC